MLRIIGLKLRPILFFGFVLAIAGCGRNNKDDNGSPEENQKQFELHEVGSLYEAYLAEKGKPPTKLQDLVHLEAGFPHGYLALKNGECVAIWGIDLKNVPGNTIIAYRKDAATSGGYAVLADQSIKTVTAADVQAAAKGGAR